VAFLLDTNVVSEPMRPRPEPRVLGWLTEQLPADLYLAATTIGELVRGARRVPDGGRRRRLEDWVETELAMQFAGRILPFDYGAARIWGTLMGDGDRAGRTPPPADAQIAAIALQGRLTLVTRNTKHLAPLGVEVLNPWPNEGA